MSTLYRAVNMKLFSMKAHSHCHNTDFLELIIPESQFTHRIKELRIETREVRKKRQGLRNPEKECTAKGGKLKAQRSMALGSAETRKIKATSILIVPENFSLLDREL